MSRIKHSTSALVVGSLGVVFGDIGTSPLYAFKVCFTGLAMVEATPANILGLASLIFWSMALVLGVQFAWFMLQVDDEGEGGIFPMLALLQRELGSKLGGRLVLTALFGAALLYGDGVITPVISVLSAVEGLGLATKALEPAVVPVTCAVLVALFWVQSHGTHRIGRFFGPVMLLWFATLAALGGAAIARRPEVLAALNPAYALGFFAENGIISFFALANVVLCITGCEALHADMGHFGPRPIRLSWFLVAMPALTVNYLGQAANLLDNPAAAAEPFYSLVPPDLLYPMVLLATAATIIASQAIISGVFSQTRQAVQLGFMPRMRVVHTSAMAEGQVYIPEVNAFMMVSCLALTLAMRQSEALADAYGLAVTTTMLVTSLLFYHVARRIWRWKPAAALALSGGFIALNGIYWLACLAKLLSGGWLPMLIGAAIMVVMMTWKDGWRVVGSKMYQMRMPIDKFIEMLKISKPLRVPGTGVFLSTFKREIPPMLLYHVNHNSSLHKQVVILSVVTENVPHVEGDKAMEVQSLGEGVFRATIHAGFMDIPDVPRSLKKAEAQGLVCHPKNTKYFLGRVSLVPAARSSLMPWRRFLFSFLQRNAVSPAVYYNLPTEQVLELGVQLKF